MQIIEIDKINDTAEELLQAEDRETMNTLFNELMFLMKIPIDRTVNKWTQYKNSSMDHDDIANVVRFTIFQSIDTWKKDEKGRGNFLGYAMRCARMELIHQTSEDATIRVAYSTQQQWKKQKGKGGHQKITIDSTERLEEEKKYVSPHKTQPLDETLIVQEEIKDLYDAIKMLQPKYRDIIIIRYGFFDDPVTMDELAEEYGCTKQNIYALQVTALNKLREILTKNKFNPEYIMKNIAV